MSKLSNIVISAMIVMVIALAFGGGFLLGQAQGPINPSGTDIVDQAWNIITARYVDPTKLNSSNMSRAAIEGIIGTLGDPYTSYLTSDELQQLTSSLQGEYTGIGAIVTIRDGNLTIIMPFPDSPAEKAGIKAGDIVLEIDGESIVGLDLELATSRMKGPADTKVNLLILRSGEAEPFLVEVTREVIEIPSVTYELNDSIAYIALYQFTQHTDAELTKIIEKLKEGDTKGIVLDLRGNGGGLLDSAAAVASHFLDSGTVVTTINNAGEETRYEVNEDALHTELPMIILVDGDTASSSEVVAGALQDYGRALICGKTTYGKGAATVVYQLKDGSALNVTIAHWFTPNGRLIEGQGIEPDIELELTGEEAIQWAVQYLLDNSVQ